MTRHKLLFTFITVLFFTTGISAQQADPLKPDMNKPAVLPGYKLAWHDEFNSTGKPDTSNWKYEHGFMRNEELQWYSENNAYCKNGVLLIEGRKEQTVNPQYNAASNDWRLNRQHAEYTSSSIQTHGKNNGHMAALR